MEQTIREVGLNTPPKFDIAPEKWWLEDYFPIGNVTFKGHVKLWEGKGFEDSWEVVARMEQQKELEPFNMEYLGDKYHTIKDIFSIKTRVFLINLSLFGIWSLFFGSRQLRGRPWPGGLSADRDLAARIEIIKVSFVSVNTLAAFRCLAEGFKRGSEDWTFGGKMLLWHFLSSHFFCFGEVLQLFPIVFEMYYQYIPSDSLGTNLTLNYFNERIYSDRGSSCHFWQDEMS